jgi:hypothetical protein
LPLVMEFVDFLQSTPNDWEYFSLDELSLDGLYREFEHMDVSRPPQSAETCPSDVKNLFGPGDSLF